MKKALKYDAQYYTNLVHYFASRFKNQFRFKELNYRQNSAIFELLMRNNKIGCCLIGGKNYVNLFFDDYMVVSKVDFNNLGLLAFNDIKIEFPNLNNYLGEVTTFTVDKDSVVGNLDLNHSDGYMQSIMDTIKYYAKELAVLKFKIDLIKDQMSLQYLLFLNLKNEKEKKNLFDIYDVENNLIKITDTEALKAKPIETVSNDVSNNLERLIIHKQEVLRELYTFLGFESSQQISKKEHLITDEVSPEVITSRSYKQIFKDCLQGFGNRVGEVLGLPLTLIVADDVVIQEKLLQDKNNNEFSNSNNSNNSKAFKGFGAAGGGYSAPPSGNKSKAKGLGGVDNSLNGNDSNNNSGGSDNKPLPGGNEPAPNNLPLPTRGIGGIDGGDPFNPSGRKKKKGEDESNNTLESILKSISALLGSVAHNNNVINNLINRNPGNQFNDINRQRDLDAAERFERENFYRLRFENMLRDQQRQELGQGNNVDDFFFNLDNQIANVFHRFHRENVNALADRYQRYYHMDLTTEQVTEIFIKATEFFEQVRRDSFGFQGRPGADYEIFNNEIMIPGFEGYNGRVEMSEQVRHFYEGLTSTYQNLQPWQAEIITYDALTLNDFINEHFELAIAQQTKKYINLFSERNAFEIPGEKKNFKDLIISNVDKIPILFSAINGYPYNILGIVRGDAVSVHFVDRAILNNIVEQAGFGQFFHNVFNFGAAALSNFFSNHPFAAGILGTALAGQIILPIIKKKNLEKEIENAKKEIYENLKNKGLNFQTEIKQEELQAMLQDQTITNNINKFLEDEIGEKLKYLNHDEKINIYFNFLKSRLNVLKQDLKEYKKVYDTFDEKYNFINRNFVRKVGWFSEYYEFTGSYPMGNTQLKYSDEALEKNYNLKSKYLNLHYDYSFDAKEPIFADVVSTEAMNNYRIKNFKNYNNYKDALKEIEKAIMPDLIYFNFYGNDHGFVTQKEYNRLLSLYGRLYGRRGGY